MPEVDAVGADAEPAHRGRPQEVRADVRVRVDDRHDRRHRRQPDQREPSPVEERLELAEVEEEPDQAPQGDDGEHVQKERGRPSPAPPEPSPVSQPEPLMPGLGRTILLPRRPQEGERRSAQQPRSPRVRAKVDPRRVHARRVHERHRHRRGRRPHKSNRQHAPASEARGPEAQPDGKDNGPDQVELLLHRQRPKMLQHRRPSHRLEVGFLAEDQEPVRHVPDGGYHVGPQPRHLPWQEHHGEGKGHHKQHVERGQEPPGASEPEILQVDGPLLAPLC